MKKLLTILFTLMILACSTTETTPASEERLLIWEVDQLIQDGTEYIGQYFEEVYITHNYDRDETHVTCRFNNHNVYNFEQLWNTESKGIRLDNLYIVQKFKYKEKDGELTISSAVYDVVLEGINTAVIRRQINRQVYTERAGESPGVIQLIIGIWNPSILDAIPFPKFNRGDTYKISSLGDDKFRLKSKNTTLDVTNKGEHFWLGY